MSRYNYVLTDNGTGIQYDEKFTVAHAAQMGEPDEAITEDGGLPRAAAQRLIDIWNRAQRNYKGEFSYTLKEVA